MYIYTSSQFTLRKGGVLGTLLAPCLLLCGSVCHEITTDRRSQRFTVFSWWLCSSLLGICTLVYSVYHKQTIKLFLVVCYYECYHYESPPSSCFPSFSYQQSMPSRLIPLRTQSVPLLSTPVQYTLCITSHSVSVSDIRSTVGVLQCLRPAKLYFT